MTLIHEVFNFSGSQFLEKIQKQIRKLPKRFADCELRTANSNPASSLKICYTFILILYEILAFAIRSVPIRY